MQIIKNKWVLLIGALILIVGLFFAFGRIGQRNNNIAAADTEKTAVAFIGDLAESATASGQVEALQEARLALVASGVVEQVAVAVGDTVMAGDILVQLETAALSRSVTSAEADVVIAEANLATLQAPPTAAELASAEAAVTSAQLKRDELLAGPTAQEIAASEAAVAAAQANVWSASGTLTAAYDVDEADILEAEAALQTAIDNQTTAHNNWVFFADCELNADNIHTCTADDSDLMEQLTENVALANAQVAQAQARLNELSNPDGNSVASQQANVAANQAQYEAALAKHEALLLGASDADIAAAEADLVNAQAALAALVDGPSSTDLTIYQTRLAQAQTALQEAQNALADATLVAPFAGAITAVYVTQGEQASGVAIDMVNTNKLEVVLNVDEIDVGRLRVNQSAIVILETWPNDEIDSTITAIAPSADEDASGIVTYDVHLGLQESDLPILVGMTANANLITANRQDVLLVPNAAITADRQNNTYSVNVVQTNTDGTQAILPIEVTIGLRDSDYTQITNGLQEGDEVVIGQLNAPVEDNFGPPSDRRE